MCSLSEVSMIPTPVFSNTTGILSSGTFTFDSLKTISSMQRPIFSSHHVKEFTAHNLDANKGQCGLQVFHFYDVMTFLGAGQVFCMYVRTAGRLLLGNCIST